MGENLKVKLEFKALEENKFVQVVRFPVFYENEWVWYVLSRIHDKFMWLNQSCKITKDVIQVVTSRCSSGGFPLLRSVMNQMVTDATGSRFDKRAITINDIAEPDVKFSSMVVGYKVYHSNKENSVSETPIYVAYQC